MSKREATFQGDKRTGLIDMNQPQDGPRRATAAQLANRKIKAARSSRSRHASPVSTSALSANPDGSAIFAPSFATSQSPMSPAAPAFGGASNFSSSFNFSVGGGETPNPFAQAAQQQQQQQQQQSGGFGGFKGSIFNVNPSNTFNTNAFGAGGGGQSASFTFGAGLSSSGGGIFGSGGSSSFNAPTQQDQDKERQLDLSKIPDGTLRFFGLGKDQKREEPQFKIANPPHELQAMSTPDASAFGDGSANMLTTPFGKSSGVLPPAPASGGGDAMEISPDGNAKSAEKPAFQPSATQSSNIFGSVAPAPTTSIFGSSSAAAPSEPPKFSFGSTNVFGKPSAETTASTTTTAPTGGIGATTNPIAGSQQFAPAEQPKPPSSPFTFGSTAGTGSGMFGDLVMSKEGDRPVLATNAAPPSTGASTSIFGQSFGSTAGSNVSGSFGKSEEKKSDEQQQAPEEKPAAPHNVFGGLAATPSQAAATGDKQPTNIFGSAASNTSTSTPSNPFASAAASPFTNASTTATSAPSTTSTSAPVFGAPKFSQPTTTPAAPAAATSSPHETAPAASTPQPLFGAPAPSQPAEAPKPAASLSGASAPSSVTAPATAPAPAEQQEKEKEKEEKAEKPVFGAPSSMPLPAKPLFGAPTSGPTASTAAAAAAKKDENVRDDRIKAIPKKNGTKPTKQFRPRVMGPTVALNADGDTFVAFDRRWRLRALNETLRNKISQINVETHSVDSVLEFYLNARKAIGCPLGQPFKSSKKRKHSGQKEGRSKKRVNSTAKKAKTTAPPKETTPAKDVEATKSSASAPTKEQQSTTASIFASSFHGGDSSLNSGSATSSSATGVSGNDKVQTEDKSVIKAPEVSHEKKTTTPSPEPPQTSTSPGTSKKRGLDEVSQDDKTSEETKKSEDSPAKKSKSDEEKEKPAEPSAAPKPSATPFGAGSIFGSASSSTTSSSPFLGSGSDKSSEATKPSNPFGTASASSQKSIFGSMGSASTAGTTPSLFGSTTTNPPANPFSSAASDPSLFGKPSSAPITTGSIFGQPSSTNTSSIFAGAAPAKPTAESTSAAAPAEDDEDKTDDPQLDLLRPAPGEDETVLYELRSQLLKLESGSGWKVQGLGLARVMKNKKTKKAYIVHRLDPSGRVLLNAPLSPKLNYTARDRAVLFTVPVEGGPAENYTLRAGKNAAKDAEEMAKILEENKKGE